MVKEYESVEQILEARLPKLVPENQDTQDLMRDMARAVKKGRFDMGLLGAIWDWKNGGTQFAPHTRQLFEQNTNADIVRISRAVFAETSDMERLRLLDGLVGVGVPIASAVLMFINPQRYGVVDVHIWKLLHRLRQPEVALRDPGWAFASSFAGYTDWSICVDLYRRWGTEFSRKARDIERCLFDYDRLWSAP